VKTVQVQENSSIGTGSSLPRDWIYRWMYCPPMLANSETLMFSTLEISSSYVPVPAAQRPLIWKSRGFESRITLMSWPPTSMMA